MVTTAIENAEITNPKAMQDSELQSLPSQGPAIETARALFAPDDNKDDQENDLMKTIEHCLKEAKRGTTAFAIKSITHLVAVSAYVNLRARYQKSNTCKRPCLSASTVIAQRMGRGPYFARQIRHNELYLRRHRHLPPPKSYARNGHHTLLDNESISQNVRTYLVSQALGSVMPLTFCQHVNAVILPALGIEATITESTVQRWLRFKLGYECKEAKKGMYVDGHERPDVIKEREEFLKKIFESFEPYVERVHCPMHQVSY